MKVLWLATNPRDNPSTRFRVLQYVEPLGRRGIEVTVRILLSPRAYRRPRTWRSALAGLPEWLWLTLRRAGDVLTAGRYDAVVVLREVYPFGPSLFERLLRAVNPRLAYDFDDAVHLRFEQARNPLDRFRDFDKTPFLIRHSRWTVAGSRYLQNYARQYSPNVELIPTVVDPEQYRVKRHQAGSRPVVLGWMGTRNNLVHLDLVAPVLRTLQARHGVRLVVVCDRDYAGGGLRVENRRWEEAREGELLQAFDVGLMPLHDDEYSKGKCAFKAIQYMASGIPPVCSPVGENRRVVSDGVNGFLAGSPGEWEAKLERLILDPDLRRGLGARGREHVERHYSLRVGLEKWREVFQFLCDGDAAWANTKSCRS